LFSHIRSAAQKGIIWLVKMLLFLTDGKRDFSSWLAPPPPLFFLNLVDNRESIYDFRLCDSNLVRE